MAVPPECMNPGKKAGGSTGRLVVQSQMTICVWERASYQQPLLALQNTKGLTLRLRDLSQTDTPRAQRAKQILAPYVARGLELRSHLYPEIRVMFARRSRNSWRVRNLCYTTPDLY